MKLWPEGFFTSLRHIGTKNASPDDGFEILLEELATSDALVSHLEYVIEVEGTPNPRPDNNFHYGGIRFHFTSGKTLDVQLGPYIENLVSSSFSDKLYYLSRDSSQNEGGPYRFAPNP